MKLLYHGPIDGFGNKNFHKICDGHKNIFTLVLRETNIVFGTFTELEWNINDFSKEGKIYI